MVMSCLELGLQMRRRMKILAFLPGASTFDIIHADRHSVIAHFDHGSIRRVSVAAIILPTGAISTLKFPANLKEERKPNACTHTHMCRSDDWKVMGYLFCHWI